MQIVNDFKKAFRLSIVTDNPIVDDLCMMIHQLLIVKNHIHIINLLVPFNCEASPSNRRQPKVKHNAPDYRIVDLDFQAQVTNSNQRPPTH